MAKRLRWSQESLDDIDAIAEYISRDAVYHAQRVVDHIFTVGETLLEQPKAGRMVPEFEQELIRERFIYSYRLIYEITPQEVHILAVIHGRRLLESVEDRFDS